MEFLLGCLVSGGTSFVVSFLLLAVYNELAPRVVLAEQERKRLGSAFGKTLTLGVMIGLLSFIINYCDTHGWRAGVAGPVAAPHVR